ncbi:Breast cancer type 2 susceptibility protein like protein [Habropoda laboriosa]|uniref:Breast cancer type 2 susceptibility protein like protein n=1 Tax=Habropoda laboriosa TaxID=597456 RepID=A0A0L7QWL9_9HYME|nr:Breast cancer type 2 susceptibility protein like protein [Habropoda laboriosa]
MQLPNVGFQTASGHRVNVSSEALLKAKNFFTDALKEIDNNEEVSKIQTEEKEFKTLLPNIAFQTASGQHINVSNEALLKTKILLQEEISDSPECNLVLSKSQQKRKIKDLDDNVPSNKPVKCNQFKKLRFSNEFQVSKTVHRNLINIEEKDNQSNPSVSREVLTSNYFTEEWISPAESKENEDTANVPSSPVIGGQFIPKKRKSIGGKKKSINALKNKEDKSMCTNYSKEVYDNCVNSDHCISEKNKCLIEKEELINNERKSDICVMNEFGDTQLMIDFINHSVTILEKRLEAAIEQDKQISLKQKNKPKPTISKLYFHKKSNTNRVSWKEISKGNKPIPCTYKELIEQKLPLEILDVTADNAIAYKFRCTDFYGQDTVQNNIDGIKLEDGACLILDENGYAGIIEIKRSFLASPGVVPDLLPTKWVENHYKWIVWKLASMNRIKFGSIALPRVLTPAKVMMELKYRYDREIDRSQRSALRKILEKDDVASKRMVLCVASIIEHDDSASVNKSPNHLTPAFKKLILTDGWYSIQASIDQAMVKNIMSGKIKEGTKLLTYGSELLNCDQGYPPLEVPENVSLKIHTNSTRRARWDLKLGYIVPLGPICIKLRTIFPNGGLIGKIKVTIARVYPMLYHEKTSAGESKEKYFYTRKSKNNSNPDSIDLAAFDWNEDCEKLSKEEFLSEQELEQLKNNCRTKEENFRQKLESRLQKSLPPPRQVTPLLKIRVIEEEINATLSIWSPSEDVTDILKEGNYISICNVVPSARRGNELQLTANRNALFNQINVFNTNYLRRTYTALCDISKSTFTPAYGEFDTVGIVVSIGSEPYGMKNFQAVYLAYPYTCSQSSYLSILFWHGISSYGYTEILTIGSFVACNNLEWRRSTSWNIPMAYCTERSTFTRNPRQSHLQKPFDDLTRLITDASAYIGTCSTEISEEIQKKSMTRMSDQYMLDRNNFDKISLNENSNSDRQFSNCTSQECPGRSLLSNHPAKSTAIQKRLEKLQCYGEPSSLSPIVLNNSSKRVSLDFQSPLKSTDKKLAKSHISLNAKLMQNHR